MNFNTWFETFCEEKQIDMDRIFKFDDHNGFNVMPVGCVYEAVLSCSAREKAQIKDVLVKIDYANGDVYHFLEHLAKGLAANA